MGLQQLILQFLSLTILVNSKPFEVVQLKSSQGILVEDMGTAATYNSIWKVVTYIIPPQLEDNISYLKQCDDILVDLCKEEKINPLTVCNYWHSIFKQNLNRIEEHLLEINTFVNKSRQKRGLLNIIGRFSKCLFGTMDDADSEKIFKKLNSLGESTKINLDFVEKQLTLIQSNFDELSKPLESLIEDQVSLAKDLEYLKKDVEKNRQITKINEIVLIMVTQTQRIQEVNY